MTQSYGSSFFSFFCSYVETAVTTDVTTVVAATRILSSATTVDAVTDKYF